MTTCVAARCVALMGAAAAGVSMIGAAQAQGITGEFLRSRCDRTSADWEKHDQWICGSYIRGAVDGIRTQAFLATGSFEAHVKVMPFCIPAGTDLDATIDVVVRYLEANPASRSQAGALAVSEALTATWPCPR